MIKKSPLISVIMNARNSEKYLDECLRSLKTQSYKKWELVFFDNCSSDNTKKILKKSKIKKLKYYFSKSRLKLYRARNLAIKKASGDYITFLDTDDIWAKDKLQKQINFLRKNTEFKMIYSNYYIIDKYKKNKKLKFNSPLPSGKITDNLLKEYVIAILTVMVEKNIILKNKFNEKYEIIGDFDLFLKLSKNYKIGKIQKPLAFYRQHETNFSKKTKIYKDELNEWIVNNHEKLTKSGHNLTYLKFYLFKLKMKNLIKLILNLGV